MRDSLDRLGLTARRKQLAGSLSGGWETAPGPGRRRPARAPPAAAGRADGGRRSQGAAGSSGTRSTPFGGRADRHGLDPLHGRGRALAL
ncbi:hypothetical protein ACRAWD_24115 [Caulobacter segnis]